MLFLIFTLFACRWSAESPDCDIELARQCIVEFGVEVLAYYNGNRDIGVVCALDSIKSFNYTVSSLH